MKTRPVARVVRSLSPWLIGCGALAFAAAAPATAEEGTPGAPRPAGPLAPPKSGAKEINPITGREPADVMGVMGASWLERASRIDEEHPETVIRALELRPEDVVADIGCGSGFYVRRIAPLVPNGKVLGVDIQPGMIELLKGDIKKNNLTNVVPILSGEVDPNLPKGGVDWVLMVDVYHEFGKPREMLAKILESLSPRGKVALVEFRLLGPTASQIKIEHRMSVKQVLAEWQPEGFELVDLIEDLPMQHLFIFQRRGDCGETTAAPAGPAASAAGTAASASAPASAPAANP